MAPPRKIPTNQTEAARLEKQRERNRARYRRNRNEILARNKVTHAKNRDKYLKRKNENARLRTRREAKERRTALRKEPTIGINPTIEALGGFFSGDGCAHSDSRRLSFFSETLEVAKAFEAVLGGSVRKAKRQPGYIWTAQGEAAIHAARQLVRYAPTKQDQIEHMLNVFDKGLPARFQKEEMEKMKHVEPTLRMPLTPAIVAGFFSADGFAGRRVHQPYVVFGQKYRAILDAIAALFPGGSEVKPYNPSCNGCKTNKDGNAFEAYQLTYSGDAARHILEKMEPFIVVERKREIARLLLSMNKENSDEIRKEIDRLNVK